MEMYESEAHIAKFACKRENARKTSITIPQDKANSKAKAIELLS